MDPSIKKQAWSTEEDLILMSLQREMGNKWSLIKKRLPGRSENDVKNRYHCITSRIHTRLKAQLRQTGPRSEVYPNLSFSVPFFQSTSSFMVSNYSVPINPPFQGFIQEPLLQPPTPPFPTSDPNSNSILPLSRIEKDPVTFGEVPPNPEIFLGEDMASYPYDMIKKPNQSELFDCQNYDNPDSVILDDCLYTGGTPVYNGDSVLSML